MGQFPSTHWSMVAQAGGSADDRQHRAICELLRRYVPALRAHVIARRRVPSCEADDLVQEFLLSKVVQEGLIAKADRHRGRFRTFLLTALDRFVANQLRSLQAVKRGNDRAQSIARMDDLPSDRRVEDEFDASWAREVIAQATQRMRQWCLESGREDLWLIFQARMLRPIIDRSPPMPYEHLVADLKLASVAEAGNRLVTAKRMFARALRSVIGDYESDPAAIEEELLELRAALAGTRNGTARG